MRTGLKILLKKIINQLKHPTLLYSDIDIHLFPETPVARIKIRARIFAIMNILKKQGQTTSVGNILITPHSIAVEVLRKILPFNPNNLGNWSINKIQPKQETTIIEKEVISKMINLYHGNIDDTEGVMTSGATEGNLFSCWIGREYLKRKISEKDKLCLLKTNLTHYSIRKSSNITGLEEFIIPLSKSTWSIDASALKNKIISLNKEGYKGFLIPLTLGYTATGTCDPIAEICKITKELKYSLKIHFFLWIDAALNGLIEPFLNRNYTPFQYNEIQTFLTDFHKFGFVPYPAGLILYRKHLRKLIEKPIDYLEENDSTILGSRPGVSALASWAVIHTLGKDGFTKIIKNRLLEKQVFIDSLSKISKKIEIITDSNSLTVGVIFYQLKYMRLPKFIEKKYGLYSKRTKINFSTQNNHFKYIYKFFFLSPSDKMTVHRFLEDLSYLIKNC